MLSVIRLKKYDRKKTPPPFLLFLSDITFMLFINVDRTYARLSDITFMFFINVERTYAKLSDITFMFFINEDIAISNC